VSDSGLRRSIDSGASTARRSQLFPPCESGLSVADDRRSDAIRDACSPHTMAQRGRCGSARIGRSLRRRDASLRRGSFAGKRRGDRRLRIDRRGQPRHGARGGARVTPRSICAFSSSLAVQEWGCSMRFSKRARADAPISSCGTMTVATCCMPAGGSIPS